MSYLVTQIFLYMLATFLLGLLLGWLWWRYGKPSLAEINAIQSEREAWNKERIDLNTNLDSCRSRFAKERETVEALRADKIDLQNRLEAVETQTRDMPELATVPSAAAIAEPATFSGAALDEAPLEFSGVASKPEGLSAPRGGQADPLQEISGVGPTMETLLHSLGYFHFDQIASWTPAEVAWVDDNLEGFKGRVTRDNWVSQAKDLMKS